jgi:hypothetical protein
MNDESPQSADLGCTRVRRTSVLERFVLGLHEYLRVKVPDCGLSALEPCVVSLTL